VERTGPAGTTFVIELPVYQGDPEIEGAKT
jgi:hypothetical protein